MITLLVLETMTNSLPQSKHALNDGTQTLGYLDKYVNDFQILFVHNKLTVNIIVVHFQVTIQMLDFEMGLEVITTPKCPCATINGARKFVVNRSINNNLMSDNIDLTS
jgi:hypothetical protein